jgi:hypothetical protein
MEIAYFPSMISLIWRLCYIVCGISGDIDRGIGGGRGQASRNLDLFGRDGDARHGRGAVLREIA